MLFAYFFISTPVYTAEIPKNSKLNPMIIEITASEIIGKIMKIKPRIMERHLHLTYICLKYYLLLW